MSLHNGKRNSIKVDSAKLSLARVNANLAMSEVAVELGCSKSQVSRWEQGTLIPSEERILKMVTMYKCGDFVVGGNENGE
jgi:DNA-binding transcriptional regulator YiaG